ncbi:hypothetical protein FRC17_010806 [Serendipita sp. 399]|nr:hypothetical protein FRC17_010806 [Serendipita sp. 399]
MAFNNIEVSKAATALNALLLGSNAFTTALMWLGFFGSILVALSSVLAPLGLAEGPPIPGDKKNTTTVYVPDLSPLGYGASPRAKHKYSRNCSTPFMAIACPGNSDPWSIDIPNSTIHKFTSTPYGPFNMQFRRYWLDGNVTIGDLTMVESQLLRNGTFAVEGLLVDMTESPGIGLRNHTVPQASNGGVWTEDIFWLEPESSCVNTNLTIDFSDSQDYNSINITDRGGFSDLPPEPDAPILRINTHADASRRITIKDDENHGEGQRADLAYRAYRSAVMVNRLALKSLPGMNPPELGKTTPIGIYNNMPLFYGRMHILSLTAYVNTTAVGRTPAKEIESWCHGYDSNTTASINKPAVHCQILMSPPFLLDNDSGIPDREAVWTQNLTVCASALRASVQRVQLSSNGTKSLRSIQVESRHRHNSTLWAVENMTMRIRDGNLFWGAISTQYENDTSLSTLKSEILYLPAGLSDQASKSGDGNPSSAPGGIWGRLISALPDQAYDFAGAESFALATKWRMLIQRDPTGGPSIVFKQIWTDVAANTLVGSYSTHMVSIEPYDPSTTYDFKYGIPFILLCAIWLLIVQLAFVVFIKERIKPSYIRHFLNQTSLGRVAVGDSLLWAVGSGRRPGMAEPSLNTTTTGISSQTGRIASGAPNQQVPLSTSAWEKTVGKKLVRFGPLDSALRRASNTNQQGRNSDPNDDTPGGSDAEGTPKNISIRVALEYLVRLGKEKDNEEQTTVSE